MRLLKNMYHRLVEARQLKANREIALLMQRNEFRHETPTYIYERLFK